MSTIALDASSVVLSLCVAAAAGLVGGFAVMRKMTLAGDALSHVALPGIGIALAMRIHPLAGALVMLLFGAFLVWALERQTRIPTETVVGVVFSSALALGAMITTGEELMDALFGGPGRLAPWELVVGFVASLAVIVLVIALRHRLIVALISPDLAATAGIDVKRLNLLYLMLFAITVALGLRYLGVLLMGALVIIPAATARLLATSLGGMLATSVVVAVAATGVGTAAAALVHQPTGPMIVCVAAAVFFLGLVGKVARA